MGKTRLWCGLLLFTAGIPSPWPTPSSVLDPERRAREIISWPLETEPGTTYAYHSVSAHWALSGSGPFAPPKRMARCTASRHSAT